MGRITLKQAAAWCGGRIDPKYEEVTFLGASNDSRNIQPGQLFLALQGVRDGTDTCAVFALISSALFYFSGSAAGPYCILFLTGLGVLLNVFRAGYLRKSFGSIFFCAGFALMVYELILFVIGLFLGHTIAERFLSFCITGGLSLIAMPILYPIFLSIGKIGGESWKD